MTVSTASVVRLALLGLLGGILQLTAVSQLTIFGVPADLVAAARRLRRLPRRLDRRARSSASASACSSTSRSARRSASARSCSPRVGYGAGRMRELRDPAHGLAPVAVGAVATASPRSASRCCSSCSASTAPVSLLLLREILMTIVLNTLLALPVYALVRRALLPVPARRPAPPPAPGLHDRRPEPAEPRLMPQRVEERRPADHAPARVARRRARRDRVRAVRDRLLPALVPAGADRAGVARRGAARTACARCRSRRRAATSWTATARRWCRPSARRSSSSCRRRCRKQVRDDAEAYREALSAAERARLRAQASYEALPAPAPRRRAQDDQAEAARARELQGAGDDGARRSPIPPIPDDRRAAATSTGASREVIEVSPQHDPRARDPRHRRRAVLERHDPHRRPAGAVQLHARAPRVLPGHRRRHALPARYPQGELAAQLFGTVSEISEEQRNGGRALQGRRRRHPHRPERARVAVRRLPARQGRLTPGRRRRARHPRRAAQGLGDRADPGRAPAADARLRPAEGRRRRRMKQAIANSEYPARAGAFVAMDPTTARSSPWAPTRASTRTSSPSRSRRRPTTS